ncbi:MAG TPA: hypothetical protein QGF95_19295 [Candidatus Latescibacteria bacterium]|nr:hypothetical protein [Candidatus Latescibacterota bacterium]
MRNHVVRLLLIIWPVLPSESAAQVEHLVIGQGGLAWRQASEDLLGLVDSVASGSLQPVELDPTANIAVGPQTESGQFTNIFGHVWEVNSNPPTAVEDKSPWVYGSRGWLFTIDGDLDHPTNTAPVSHYSFDLGLPVPINRVVFFPPETGRTTTSGDLVGARGSTGQLIKDQFPRQYSLSGSLNEREFLFQNFANDFDIDLGSSFNHTTRVADLRFFTQFLRFLRLRFPVQGFIAEVEFYGEGFLPQTRFVSRLFDMGEAVNFGRVHFDFETYRSSASGDDPVAAPDAPVGLAVEARSGLDDTPLIYHIVTDIGADKEVTEAEFNRAPSGTYNVNAAVIPGHQGPVLDDVVNWSFWSVPQQITGEQLQVPDRRRFIQLRAFITSEEVFAFGRLNSLSIEYSPLLADPVVGEVALMTDPRPADGIVEVPLGEPVTLTYDVRADFTASSQTGFSAIRLQTPEAVDFQRFQMGDPLADIEPDSLVIDDRELLVYFPSNPITPGSHPPLRLTFATRLFNFNTLMEGEVFDPGGENLPQSIDAGDASPLVSTNDLRVLAPLERLQVLTGLELGARILTPNADRVNDDLPISFTLQGIVAGAVRVEVYDLSGRLLHRLVDENRGEGRYTETWDGSTGTDGTRRVTPGMYLVRVTVNTDLGTFEQTRTVAVAY